MKAAVLRLLEAPKRCWLTSLAVKLTGRTVSEVNSWLSVVYIRLSEFSMQLAGTARTRGCLSRQTMLTMVFKLCQSTEKRRHRLRGYKLLADVIRGVKFVDGIREDRIAA